MLGGIIWHSTFQKMSFDSTSRGKYVVVYDGRLIGLFDTMIDADKAGGSADSKEEYPERGVYRSASGCV